MTSHVHVEFRQAVLSRTASTTLAGRQISGAAFIWAQLFAGKEQKLKGLCRGWGTVI